MDSRRALSDILYLELVHSNTRVAETNIGMFQMHHFSCILLIDAHTRKQCTKEYPKGCGDCLRR